MKAALFLLTVTLLVQLVAESSSDAYTLEPISRVFAPAGSKATQSFEIVNDGPERLAVAVSFVTLDRDDSYVETNKDAEDEFLAYPAQVIVPPKGKQTIRVTWLGAAKLTREQTYRIVVTQVPLSQLDGTSRSAAPLAKMQVMLTYRGTLFIRPAGTAPKISIHRAEHVLVAQKPMLAVTLDNAGTAVGLVRSCSIALSPAAGGAPVTLALDATTPLGNTRVLAGDRRRYLVAWPPQLALGPVKATGQCSVKP